MSSGGHLSGGLSKLRAWLARMDERRGRLDNPVARLTGRELYALLTGVVIVVVLLLMVAWRSGVNTGTSRLPYRAAAAATGTSPAASAGGASGMSGAPAAGSSGTDAGAPGD
jgi:hypothetical protein